MPRYINEEGISLIKRFEGLRLRAYKDAVGIWTVGYGHVSPSVKVNTVIDSNQAEDLFDKDLEQFCKVVNDCVKVALNDNQFAALVSFVFNVGGGSFLKSTLLKKLNLADYTGAANEFLRWNRAGKDVLPGLTIRRSAERDLFLKI